MPTTHPPLDLVVAGHVCLDQTPTLTHSPVLRPGVLTEIGPAQFSVGGVVGNVGRALARLGRPATLVAAVGDDALADLITDDLQGAAAHLRLHRLGNLDTSYTVVIAPPDADRSFWHHPGANLGFTAAHVLPTLDRGPVLLHLGYPPLLPLLVTDGGSSLADLFDRVHVGGGATSLDLVYLDPRSALATADWDGFFARVLPSTDLFCPSWDDLTSLGWISGEPNRAAIDAAADRALGLGASVVLVTAGPLGFGLATSSDVTALATATGLDPQAWTGQRLWFSPPPMKVVTTLAAGDVLKAAFLIALADGCDPRECGDRAMQTVSRHLQGQPVRSQQ